MLQASDDLHRIQELRSGDRVACAAKNSHELLIFIDACLRRGVIPAVMSSAATDREITEMSSDIDAKLVINDSQVVALTSETEFRDGPWGSGSPDYLRCRPMHFTSGTSGRPKAVWSGWFSDADAQDWVADEQKAWGITSSDVHLVCGPLSHSAPLRFALMTLWAGGEVIVPAKFDPSTVAELLPSVTTTFMAPTHLQRLMEYSGHSALPHSLRLLAHAGAACPDRVRSWAHETFGSQVVVEFYGSTEGQFTQCSPADWRSHPGSVGRARTGRAMRVDATGRLWSKASSYARFEYWGDPDKTAEAWDGDWFTVGDFGRIDEDGYVYLEGRKGDLIITGGVNVYPAEIERVLVNLPGVEHVVAFGLPDDTWGQRVCVAVVGSVDEEQVRRFARESLSGPKRPKSIFITDALPTTHSGKVDRTAVPALFG